MCKTFNIKTIKYMIAKIYPDGHPDLQGKKDPTHPVRYFDIRKLTPVECYSLMGVPAPQISILMQTEKRPYMAWVGVDSELAVFGLEPSATRREVDEAYREAVASLDSRQADDTDSQDDPDEETARIMADEAEDDAEEMALMRQNYELNYQNIWSRVIHTCKSIILYTFQKRGNNVRYFLRMISCDVTIACSVVRPSCCFISIFHIPSRYTPPVSSQDCLGDARTALDVPVKSTTEAVVEEIAYFY